MNNLVKFPERSSIEEEASLWIARFEVEENLTPNAISELKEWINQSPLHRQTLLRMASLWSDMNILEELSVPSCQTKTSAKAQEHSFNTTVFALIGWIKRQVGARKLAAGITFVCLVCVMSLTLFKPHFGFDGLSNGYYETQVGKQAKIDLPDGSSIWLNTSSKVEVSYTDTQRKLVLHYGEAFFEVAKNPNRPFEVYAAGKMVRAVGTAFSVYKLQESVKVTVTEGIVDLARIDPEIQPASQSEPVPASQTTLIKPHQPTQASTLVTKVGSLTAGQSVELKESDGQQTVVNHANEDIARSLSWRDGLLVFAGEPLNEVVREISRYTSLKITLADPEIGTMRIGGQFKTGHTEALFDVLQAGFGLEVAYRSDNQVTIYASKKQ